MAEVFGFPVKRELSEETVTRIQDVAVQCAKSMSELLLDTCDHITDEKEFEETVTLVTNTFIENYIHDMMRELCGEES